MIHSDADFMKHCFYLAEKGRGMTSPNPLVGCVIVQNDEIVATGYHRKAGLAHAELDAIENTQANLKGATLYCNLEPCCHTNKKTPPCAQRIILENISKVVIANLDPNPYVAGRGVELLRKNGIEVITGVLEEEGEKLNEIFFKNMREQKPFVHLKIAQTLDGKIATNTGSSQWITNEKSRIKVHQMRKQYEAILVGANTLREDNPRLTSRLQEHCSPLRIVLSKSGNLPLDSHLFTDEFSHKTIVALGEENKVLQEKVESLGVQVIIIESIHDLLNKIFKMGVNSLLVEGGCEIFTSFIEQQLYDRISFFIAPKIIGSGRDAIGDLGIEQMNDSVHLKNIEMDTFENNFYITGRRSDVHGTY